MLPIKEYKKILSCMEDVEDIEEIKEQIKNPQETFPMSIVEELSNGVHPIRVFREYRGLSQTTLAKKANVSKQYISQIEQFERKGTTKIIKTIAKILKVDMEDLI